MAELSKSLKTLALESLRSDECPACLGHKEPGKSFCFGCYKLLPEKVKRDLYKGINDGYAEIWDEAKEILKGLVTPRFKKM
jgi:hypothetical protein